MLLFFFLFKDNVIIKLDKTGFKTDKMVDGEDGTTDEADPILVVHPNYVVGE